MKAVPHLNISIQLTKANVKSARPLLATNVEMTTHFYVINLNLPVQ